MVRTNCLYSTHIVTCISPYVLPWCIVFSPPAQAAIASLAQWPQLTFAPGDVDGTLGSLLLSDESTGTIGYSNLSLYFTLALYLLTLPGLFSLVTRSVKVKVTSDIPVHYHDAPLMPRVIYTCMYILHLM